MARRAAFGWTLLLGSVVVAQDFTLFDVVKPSQTQRLFDTLQSSVELQYENRHVAFDVSKLFNYDSPPVSIRKLNQRYKDVLFEGDMAIPYEQLERIVNVSVGQRGVRPRRQAYLDTNYPATIWTSGVPFVLHSSLKPKAKEAIFRAIHFWYRETCIDFTPRTTETQYLTFIGNDAGCWSTVGRDASQGRQVVSIGAGCEHFGVTSHELAHALGVFHEQSRFDRDDAVVFNPDVVAPKQLYNFAKISPQQMSTYSLPYDVGSVMHYTPTEFSTMASVPALTAVNPNLQQTMGQLEGPSFLDVLLLNRHYKCEEKCKESVACQNGGFINSRNCRACKCPSGFSGKFCERVAGSFSSACGGVINVEENIRRFDITIRQNQKNRVDKQCVYHLQAPEGKKIAVNLVKINAKCIEGCWQDGVELKMIDDFRPVGYRFCCRESTSRRIISQSNLVPFIVTSRSEDVTISFEYAHVDAKARFDDADEAFASSRKVVEHTGDDVDGVSATVSLPSRTRGIFDRR